MHRVLAIALLFAFFVPAAMAVRELLIIDTPQVAQKVEGVVLDPNGDPIPNMTVSDRTEDGGAVLRSTKTDERGHFHFASQRGKATYCLRFDHPDWFEICDKEPAGRQPHPATAAFRRSS